MENNSKIWQIILAVIVVGGIAWIIIKTPAPSVVPENPDTAGTGDIPLEDPNVDSEQLCYIWNTEAGDKAQLSMDIRGMDVMGDLNWLPAEKDKKTGIFIGGVTGSGGERAVNAWWQTSAEGMMNTEQLIIKFGDSIANVGFGEMKLDAEGRYVYAHPESLSFVPNLSKTDCGDSAMD